MPRCCSCGRRGRACSAPAPRPGGCWRAQPLEWQWWRRPVRHQPLTGSGVLRRERFCVSPCQTCKAAALHHLPTPVAWHLQSPAACVCLFVLNPSYAGPNRARLYVISHVMNARPMHETATLAIAELLFAPVPFPLLLPPSLFLAACLVSLFSLWPRFHPHPIPSPSPSAVARCCRALPMLPSGSKLLLFLLQGATVRTSLTSWAQRLYSRERGTSRHAKGRPWVESDTLHTIGCQKKGRLHRNGWHVIQRPQLDDGTGEKWPNLELLC